MSNCRRMRISRFLIFILLAIVLVAVSCRGLNRERANEAFLKEYPTYSIVYSETGEGWEGVVNYHFDYKKPDGERVYQEVWTFEQQEDGTWKVTGRRTPNTE